MPKAYEIKTNSGAILIWRIEESVPELESLLGSDYSGTAKSQVHVKQQLASRVLLKEMFGEVEIEKDEFGKPHLAGRNEHISISHTGAWASVAFSTAESIGLDIEEISPRIMRIRDKFTRRDESLFRNQSNELNYLYLIWSAKESVYKQYGRKALDFKRHMRMECSEFGKEGRVQVHVSKGSECKEVPVNYCFYDEHQLVLTYTNE